MRLCVLSFSYPRWDGDDAGIFVSRLVHALQSKGASGTIIAPFDKGVPEEEKKGSFTIRRVKYGILRAGALAYGAGIMPNMRRDPTLILQAPSLIGSMTAAALQVSHTTDLVYANWIPSPVIGHLLKLTRKIPYVVSVRGEDMKLMRGRIAKAILAPSLRAASAVVSINQSFSTEIAPLLQGSTTELCTIANGIEVATIPEVERVATLARYGITAAQPFALFLGSVIPRKRVELLLRAAHRAPWPRELTLVVAGRAEEHEYRKNLEKIVKESGLEGRVLFLGQVTQRDAAALLRSAHLYLTASEFEGRPNSVLEAMSIGLPVVASSIEAHREIITDRNSGLLFEDDRSLSDAVALLFQDRELHRTLGESATRLVEGRSWAKCGDEYWEVFSRALKEPLNKSR